MDLEIDLSKNLAQNAGQYYEQVKKYKHKLEGAQEAVEKAQKKLKKVEDKIAKEEVVQQTQANKKERKKEWYEKFRWFFTSTGKLVVGGRDATTNDMVIKKYTDADDVVMHTDMAGSPFFVLKNERTKATKKELKEVADATCTFSRAWKLGLQSQDVFYVKPEQVSKEARPGEHLGKGSFMIYGKTEYMENKINLALGMKDNVLMAGPLEAVKKYAKDYVVLVQGKEKASAIAKKIQHKLGGELDEIIRLLPSGEFNFA